MSSVRIAVDGTSYRSQPTGASRRTCALLPRLAKRGWDPVLFLAKTEDAPYRNLAGVRVETTPFRHLRGPLRGWAARKWMAPRIRELGCSILLTETPPWIPTPIPVVLTVHDLRAWEAPASVPACRRIWIRRTLPNVLHLATRVVAVSQTTAKALDRHFPGSPTLVIPNAGNHFSFQKGGALQRENFLLAVGPWDSLARPRNLLAARKMLADPPPLVFVGQPRGIGSLPHGVTVRHRISDAELVDLYRRAAVTVCTSVHEGFDFPLLEALGQACPVLATDLPAHREVGGNFIQTYPAENVAGLAQALQSMQASQENTGALRTQAEKFSWDRSADLLDELLRKVLQERKA